jgi:hypothetical protein
MADLKAPAFDPQKLAKWWMDARSGTTLASQPLASMHAASSSVIPTRAFALESKMESNGRAGMEKSLCGNGLFQGSIPPAPARANALILFGK